MRFVSAIVWGGAALSSIQVRALPPKHSESRRVSFDSRNGTWCLLPSEKELRARPNMRRDQAGTGGMHGGGRLGRSPLGREVGGEGLHPSLNTNSDLNIFG